MATSRARKAVFSSIAAVIASFVGFGALAFAEPPTKASGEQQAAAAAMTPAIEDFAYPNAEQILAEKKITLKRGDGHIVLTDCAKPYNILVESRTGQEQFCFKFSGKQGYLTMEVAEAYGIWEEGGHSVQAKITADGQQSVVNLKKDDFTTLGEAGNSEKRSVLVELRFTG